MWRYLARAVGVVVAQSVSLENYFEHMLAEIFTAAGLKLSVVEVTCRRRHSKNLSRTPSDVFLDAVCSTQVLGVATFAHTLKTTLVDPKVAS